MAFSKNTKLLKIAMAKRSSTELVPPGDQVVETIEEEQTEEPLLTELDTEIECPRCHETMELQSSFDNLMYTCETCSFLLKCV